MIKAMYTAAAGMISQSQKLEIVSNNLANINTTGFKKDNAFVELMKDSAMTVIEGTEGTGGVFVKAATDFSDGSLQQTNNRLDVAIQGRGFFAVETPNGVRYTRNGNFMLGVDGTLVTNQGHPVLGQAGRIRIPDLHRLSSVDLTIDQTGEMTIDRRPIARLRIADFEDLTALNKEGDSTYSTEVPELAPVVDGKETLIRQGYLEESNVDGIEEMIQMIEISRTFETEQKSIQMQDGTLEKAMELGRM
jgi:flagellar basal-body rod protein FlgG